MYRNGDWMETSYAVMGTDSNFTGTDGDMDKSSSPCRSLPRTADLSDKYQLLSDADVNYGHASWSCVCCAVGPRFV